MGISFNVRHSDLSDADSAKGGVECRLKLEKAARKDYDEMLPGRKRKKKTLFPCKADITVGQGTRFKSVRG
jgi:hypothetical protein